MNFESLNQAMDKQIVSSSLIEDRGNPNLANIGNDLLQEASKVLGYHPLNQ